MPSSRKWRRSVTVTEVAKPRRGRETAFDMVRSFGLMVVVVGVTLLFVPSLLHPSAKDRFPAFDSAGVVEGFHQVTGLTPQVPVSLPSTFKATAGSLTGPAAAEHLHIGYAAPGSSYAGLDEAIGPTAGLVSSVLGAAGASVKGTVTVDGVAWQRRTSSRGEVALVHRIGRISVVVTGSAAQPVLVTLAASLRPAAAQSG
jgi:hypothetical protein